MRPPVEGGVLDPLGHHRTAGLLEPDHELVAPGLTGAAGRARLLAEQHLGEQVERLAPVGGEPRPGHLHRLGERLASLGPRRGAWLDVVAVPVRGDQQLDQAVLEGAPGVVAQPDVVGADVRGELGQAVHLGVQRAGDDLALGLLDHRRERIRRVTRQLVHQGTELAAAAGVDEGLLDAPERVVPGAAGGRPVFGQRLGGREDLLHHHPRVVGLLRQTGQVVVGVGQAVRVVDPQPVDHAIAHEPDHELVGGVEHLGVLDPDRGEGAHVEEPSVVQLLVRHPPVGEPVVLRGDEVGERQCFGPGADREHVVEVAQDGGRRARSLERHLVEGQLTLGEHRPDPPAEDRHEKSALAR